MLDVTRSHDTDRKSQFLTAARRVKLLAALLLADSSVAGEVAGDLDIRLAENYTVTVVRISEPPFTTENARREKIVETLLTRWHTPVLWERPTEFVALLASDDANPVHAAEKARQRALELARDFASTLTLPCSVGAATGRTGALAEAAALARRISRTAPVEAMPRRLFTLADLFVELGVTQLPLVDSWMRELADRLAGGPDLIGTLDAYYQNDMNRLNTAVSLRIHPRTLDYRLQRVRELVGIDPGSTRGVRILSATVGRALAGS